VRGRGSREGGRGSGEAAEAPLHERNMPMNSEEAREWVLDLLNLMRRAAEFTESTFDETLVDGCISAVKVDLLWDWIWRFIGPILDGEDAILVTCDTTVAQEADKAGINPATLIAIIQAIMELIKIFRNK
jgi:hypothetical protein